MNQPAISVIVPMFNSERHVLETLQSIAVQTLRNLEVIVIDDGSTDKSVALVEEFITHDERFQLITEAPQGSAGAARNAGLRMARGEYLAFLDADDLFAPTMLQKLHAKALADDADIVMTAFRSFDDVTGKPERIGRRGRLHAHLLPKTTPFDPADISEHIFTAPHTTVWNKIFKTEFIRRIGLEFEPVRRSNDAYFNMMALTQAHRLSYVNEPLVNYRASNDSSLQGSQDDTDLSWADASRSVAHELEARGLYATFQRAMIQRVATRSFDRLAKTTSTDTFSEMYETIRDSLFPDFGIDRAAESDFPDPATGSKVREFLNLPMAEWLHIYPSAISHRGGDAIAAGHSADATATAAAPHSSGTPAVVDVDVDVSVIIPVSSRPARVDEAINSVFAQAGVNVQVICVIDPETSVPPDVMALIRQDPRVEIASQNDGAVRVATGRYVVYLDAHDHWNLNFLATVVAGADTTQADVAIFDAFSYLDGTSPTNVPRAGRDPQDLPLSVAAGVTHLWRYRRVRHLRERAGVMLVRRGNASSLQLAPGDGDASVRNLDLLLHAERTVHLPLAAYAHRVDRSVDHDEYDDYDEALRSFRTYLDSLHLIRDADLSGDAATEAAAIVEDNLARAAALYAPLRRRLRNAIKSASASQEARAAYLEIERRRAREARYARRR